MELSIKLRPLRKADCSLISEAFHLQGWNKPLSQYLDYFELQTKGERDVIISEINNEFAGYLTIKWLSEYPDFKNNGIPEIVDFNVLKKYQRQSVGTVLLNEAEKRIKMKSDYAGIGVGMTKDYGAAQILYVKRGYIPDGNGLSKNGIPVLYGDHMTMDDDLVLYFLKRL